MTFKIQYKLKPYVGIKPEIEFDKLMDFNQALISYDNLLLNQDAQSLPEVGEKSIKWENIEEKISKIKKTLSNRVSCFNNILNIEPGFFYGKKDEEIKKILDLYVQAVEFHVNNLSALTSFFATNIVTAPNKIKVMSNDAPLSWLLSEKVQFLFETLKVSCLDSGSKIMELFPLEFFNYLLNIEKCNDSLYEKITSFLFSFKKYFIKSENLKANFSEFFSKNKEFFFDENHNFVFQYENIYKQNLFDFIISRVDFSERVSGNKLFFSEIKQAFFIESNKVKTDSIEKFVDNFHNYAVDVINENFLKKIIRSIYVVKNSPYCVSTNSEMIADEKIDFMRVMAIKNVFVNEFKFNKKQSVLDLYSHVNLISDFMTDYQDRFLIFKSENDEIKVSIDKVSKIHKYLFCYEISKKFNFLIKLNCLGEQRNTHLPVFLSDLLPMVDVADYDFFFSNLRLSFDELFLNKDRNNRKFNNELFAIRCGNMLTFSSDYFLRNTMQNKDGVKYINDFFIDYSIFLKKINTHLAHLSIKKYVVEEKLFELACLATTLMKKMMVVFFIKNNGECTNLNEVKKLLSPIFKQWENLIQALDNNERLFKKNNNLYYWIKSIYFLIKEVPDSELTNAMRKNIKKNGDLLIFFNKKINERITKILHFVFDLDTDYSLISQDKYESEFKFISDLISDFKKNEKTRLSPNLGSSSGTNSSSSSSLNVSAQASTLLQ